MATLDSMIVGDLYLSDDISIRDAISSFVMDAISEIDIPQQEVYLSDLQDMVHISGDSNIGALQLSATLAIGNNKVVSDNTVAIGENCQAGIKGFIPKSVDQENKTIVVNAPYSQLSSTIEKMYSIDGSGPGLGAGIVVSAYPGSQQDTTELSLSPMASKIYQEPRYTTVYFQNVKGAGTSTAGGSSLAIGQNCNAFGAYSIAQGINTIAGRWAFASGKDVAADWGCFAQGNCCSALGACGHVEGRANYSDQYCTHVEGFANEISSDNPRDPTQAGGSHVAGVAATSNDKFAWVWSGNNNTYYINNSGQRVQADVNVNASGYQILSDQRYSSHGRGTFNVNPRNGIDGFFIGEESLREILSQNTKPLSGMSFTSNDTLESIISSIAVALGATVDFTHH